MGLVLDARERHPRPARFERIRARTLPFEEDAGLLTDEDVFTLVS